MTSNTTDFICPFCGLPATAIRNPPMVMHHEPPCNKFMNLDVTEYLAAVNEENEKQTRKKWN